MEENRGRFEGQDAVVAGTPAAQRVPVDFVDNIADTGYIAESSRVDGAALADWAGEGVGRGGVWTGYGARCRGADAVDGWRVGEGGAEVKYEVASVLGWLVWCQCEIGELSTV